MILETKKQALDYYDVMIQNLNDLTNAIDDSWMPLIDWWVYNVRYRILSNWLTLQLRKTRLR